MKLNDGDNFSLWTRVTIKWFLSCERHHITVTLVHKKFQDSSNFYTPKESKQKWDHLLHSCNECKIGNDCKKCFLKFRNFFFFQKINKFYFFKIESLLLLFPWKLLSSKPMPSISQKSQLNMKVVRRISISRINFLIWAQTGRDFFPQ
jgi:hypothetical protein